MLLRVTFKIFFEHVSFSLRSGRLKSGDSASWYDHLNPIYLLQRCSMFPSVVMYWRPGLEVFVFLLCVDKSVFSVFRGPFVGLVLFSSIIYHFCQEVYL